MYWWYWKDCLTALTCRLMHPPWAVWALQPEVLAMLRLYSCCLTLQ